MIASGLPAGEQLSSHRITQAAPFDGLGDSACLCSALSAGGAADVTGASLSLGGSIGGGVSTSVFGVCTPFVAE